MTPARLAATSNRTRVRGSTSGWSTETGEVGRTLQLQGFVETVRLSPDRYRLETPAILRFPGR